MIHDDIGPACSSRGPPQAAPTKWPSMRKGLRILPQRQSGLATGPAAAALAAAPRKERCFGERSRFVQSRAGEAMAYSFDIASVSSAKVRQMHAHWEQVRGVRLMPARGDIDPAAIKPLLPFIVIAEVFHDPLRVRYRLVGTAVVEHSRFDYTGQVAARGGFRGTARLDRHL
jgi:PAS domain-containing protein